MRVLHLLKKTHVAIVMAKNRLQNQIDPPILVLIYHRVTTLTSDPQLLAVTPDNFHAQMGYLKKNFPVLRFEDDWSQVKEPSVVVTFDDGYGDNVWEALPLLEENGVPATFFVSTGDLGSNREFWWDELERIILGGGVFPSVFELHDERFGRSWPTKSCVERVALYQEIHPFMKKVDAVRRGGWLNQLRSWAGVDDGGRETHRVMTINELQRLAASDIATIGAHTVTHTALATLSAAEQQREIIESKKRLVELTGRDITVFSYPFGGRGDYTGESVRLCREAGFVRTASNFPGQAHRWTDPHQIPRHLVRNWPLEIFQSKIMEFFYR